jgi:hypothetical protein
VVEAEIFSDVIEEPQESFNPWRIVVPSVAALLVLFAVVFALTRNSSSEPSGNDNSQPLTIEPGSQPVQPAGTPTGTGEQGIAPSGGPPIISGGNTSAPGTNPNTNTGAGAPDGNTNETRGGAEPNENTEEPQASPSPTKAPTQLPTPRTTPTPDNAPSEPPPMPTPKKEQAPKQTPAPGTPGTQAPGATSAPELP